MRTAYIGMGANLPSSAGSPEATLAAAVVSLESLGSVVNRSSLYLTEPSDSRLTTAAARVASGEPAELGRLAPIPM